MTVSNSPLAILVDPRRAAVLVVDVQPLFTQGIEPSAEQVLQALRRFLRAARGANVLRVFIRFMQPDAPTDRWATLWREQFGDEFIDRAAPDSPAVAYSPGFEPETGDLAVTKDRYSAFRETDLADQLRRRGIQTVSSPASPRTSASAAPRATFSSSTSTHRAVGLLRRRPARAARGRPVTLGKVFGRVCTSDEVIAAWQARQPAAGAASGEGGTVL